LLARTHAVANVPHAGPKPALSSDESERRDFAGRAGVCRSRSLLMAVQGAIGGGSQDMHRKPRQPRSEVQRMPKMLLAGG
jgi:hypothetical protein